MFSSFLTLAADGVLADKVSQNDYFAADSKDIVMTISVSFIIVKVWFANEQAVV